MTVVAHLSVDCPLPHPMAGALARRALSHTIEEVGADRCRRVTFSDLAQPIELALRVVGESVRIQGAWANIDGASVCRASWPCEIAWMVIDRGLRFLTRRPFAVGRWPTNSHSKAVGSSSAKPPANFSAGHAVSLTKTTEPPP